MVSMFERWGEYFLALRQENAVFAIIASGRCGLGAVIFPNIGGNAFVDCQVFGRQVIVIFIIGVEIF